MAPRALDSLFLMFVDKKWLGRKKRFLLFLLIWLLCGWCVWILSRTHALVPTRSRNPTSNNNDVLWGYGWIDVLFSWTPSNVLPRNWLACTCKCAYPSLVLKYAYFFQKGEHKTMAPFINTLFKWFFDQKVWNVCVCQLSDHPCLQLAHLLYPYVLSIPYTTVYEA